MQLREVVRPLRRGLVSGLVSGLVGTAAMSATTALERWLRPALDHPVDFDASRHVAEAVGTVLRHPPRTAGQRRVYFALAHWGYGSAVALGYVAVRAQVEDERVAAAAFYAGCQTMAFSLFPTLGGTEPPWRWRRDVLVSSFVQHAVYVAGVAVVQEALARGG